MSLKSPTRKRKYSVKKNNYFDLLPRELLLIIFQNLSGTNLRSCACVCRHWNYMIKTILISDTIIVCDITKSVSMYWPELLLTLNDIFFIHDHIRFGFVGYTDHFPSFKPHQLISSYPMTYDVDSLLSNLNSLTLGKGKDYPEAVLDGLYHALTLNWRSNSNKSIILICDSPPHGAHYPGDYHDNFPEGCPCGLKESFIFSTLAKYNIPLSIIYTRIEMQHMISIFTSYYSNIKSFLVDDLNFFPILNSICEDSRTSSTK